MRKEKAIVSRDLLIGQAELQYAEEIFNAGAVCAGLAAQLEEYFLSHRPANASSIVLPAGTIGMQSAGVPALLPLNEKWTWKKIELKLKRLYKARFFHKPKPAGIDKNKVKKELTTDDLAKCGLKVETSESFYIDLKRYDEAA